MSNDFMGTSDFYPHKGPSKYAYTTAFYDFRRQTGEAAKANTNYSSIAVHAGNKFEILSNLKLLIDGARNAEVAFLTDTGIDLSQGINAKIIFENFNLILNSEELFNRNLALLKEIAQNETGSFRDPSKYFFSYLSKYIKEYGIAQKINTRKLVGPQLKKFANEVIGRALEDTYRDFKEAVDGSGKSRQLNGNSKLKNNEKYRGMYTEMADMIQKLRRLGVFGKYASLFKIDSLAEEAANTTGQIVRKPHLTINSFDNGGTPLEIVSSEVTSRIAQMHSTTSSGGSTLIITGALTGGDKFNKQKGDSMIAYATSKINFNQMAKFFPTNGSKGSTRVQNIQALREYLQTVGNRIKHLLVISDKSYHIHANWRGVHAQEPMSLANAQAMLEQFGVPEVEALINYLANCGSGMIQGDVNAQVRTTLASYIAYFLFDHVEISGINNIGTNVVNIINLNNTYIPLSVYLQGVYDSLNANLNNLDQSASTLVNVTVSLGGIAPTTPWTPAAWQGFREGREQNSFINYRITQDIAAYITNLMQQ